MVSIVEIAMKRRQFVKASGAGIALLTTSLAGCAGEGSNDSENVVTGGNGGNGGGNNNNNNKDTTQKSQQSKTTEQSQKKVKVLNHELYTKDYSAGVKGKIKNVSGKELGYVEITVRFFDSEDTRIAEGLDNFSELGAGTTATFDAMYMGQEPSKIDSYELEVSAGFM